MEFPTAKIISQVLKCLGCSMPILQGIPKAHNSSCSQALRQPSNPFKKELKLGVWNSPQCVLTHRTATMQNLSNFIAYQWPVTLSKNYMCSMTIIYRWSMTYQYIIWMYQYHIHLYNPTLPTNDYVPYGPYPLVHIKHPKITWSQSSKWWWFRHVSSFIKKKCFLGILFNQNKGMWGM